MTKEEVTVDWILKIIRMFPTDTQIGLLFGNGLFGTPHAIILPDGNHTPLIMDTEEKKKIGIESKLQYMATSQNVGEVFYHISKPNRLQIFEITSRMRSYTESDYNKILKNIWITTEFPHQMPIPKIVNLFKPTKRELLMTSEDFAYFNGFPETVTIYRGLMDSKAKVRGLSWTTDPITANWFTKRFAKNGNLMKAKINKKHIFMFTNERKEYECVINPRGLQNIEATTIEMCL